MKNKSLLKNISYKQTKKLTLAGRILNSAHELIIRKIFLRSVQGGTMNYYELHPLDLIQILKPGQILEISQQELHHFSNFETLSLRATLNSFHEQTLIVDFPYEAKPFINTFKPGAVVTIETSRYDGCTCFKSKILQQDQVSLQLVLAKPRIMTSKERRSEPRLSFVTSITYQILSFQGRELPHLQQKFGHGESINLSRNGMTLRTNLDLPLNLVILIKFNFIGNETTLTGIIRNSNAATIGVQFLRPSRTGTEFIQQILTQQNSAKAKFM